MKLDDKAKAILARIACQRLPSSMDIRVLSDPDDSRWHATVQRLCWSSVFGDLIRQYAEAVADANASAVLK